MKDKGKLSFMSNRKPTRVCMLLRCLFGDNVTCTIVGRIRIFNSPLVNVSNVWYNQRERKIRFFSFYRNWCIVFLLGWLTAPVFGYLMTMNMQRLCIEEKTRIKHCTKCCAILYFLREVYVTPVRNRIF